MGDVKDTVKSLFKATKRLLTVKENCDGEHARHCAHNALKIVASFAGMGQYLAAAVGRCSPNTVKNKGLRDEGQCVEQVMELTRHLQNVGRASVDLNKYCEIGEQRLYQLENRVEVQGTTGGSATLALVAPGLPSPAHRRRTLTH